MTVPHQSVSVTPLRHVRSVFSGGGIGREGVVHRVFVIKGVAEADAPLLTPQALRASGGARTAVSVVDGVTHFTLQRKAVTPVSH